jgi:hypothetical protein
MKRTNTCLRLSIDLILLLALGLTLAVAVHSFTRGKPASSPPAQVGGEALVAQETAGLPYPQPMGESPVTTTTAEIPYPPPTIPAPLPETPEIAPPTLTPTSITQAPLPSEELSRLMGRAATLRDGNIWLLEPDRKPEAFTDFGDVAAIFGWNYDGTMLLFGRGRIEQPEFVGDTTELWVLDVYIRQARQLTSGNIIKTAGWSPVEDRIAYCELGDVLIVSDLDGKKYHQLERAICGYTWSPDGSAIAVETYTPDMIDSDGLKYTVLAIWELADEKLQVFSDAKDEAQYWPVWSMDGKRVFFERRYYDPKEQEQGLSGRYVFDVTSGQAKRLEGTVISSQEISRSPRADLITYRIGADIYISDFDGQSEIVAQGRSPLWLPDGKTLLYHAEDGGFQTVVVTDKVIELSVGGQQPVTSIYIQPEYFFAPGGKP